MKSRKIAVFSLVLTLVLSCSSYGQQAQPQPSLRETINWLSAKVLQFSGSSPSSWNSATECADASKWLECNANAFGYQSFVQDQSDPSGCTIAITGNSREVHRSYLSGSTFITDKTWTFHITVPLAYLKKATALGRDVTLVFDGAKLVRTREGTEYHNMHDTWEKTDKPSTKPISMKDAFFDVSFTFARDPGTDNYEMAQRVAKAFDHARELCKDSRPARDEPF